MIVNSASQRAKEVNQVYIFMQGTNRNEVGDADFLLNCIFEQIEFYRILN